MSLNCLIGRGLTRRVTRCLKCRKVCKIEMNRMRDLRLDGCMDAIFGNTCVGGAPSGACLSAVGCCCSCKTVLDQKAEYYS